MLGFENVIFEMRCLGFATGYNCGLSGFTADCKLSFDILQIKDGFLGFTTNCGLCFWAADWTSDANWTVWLILSNWEVAEDFERTRKMLRHSLPTEKRKQSRGLGGIWKYVEHPWMCDENCLPANRHANTTIDTGTIFLFDECEFFPVGVSMPFTHIVSGQTGRIECHYERTIWKGRARVQIE